MKRSTMWLRAWLACAAGLIACGENLIVDPSFDLWCGKRLCAPWQVSGQVSRVSTWHRHDYAVSLADDSSLTQLSEAAAVSCIELELITDVSASANVWLELDFNDDGSAEYRQPIPESHWAKLRYLVGTPRFYDGVRFTLRKLGNGRAVLAQIKAMQGSGCDEAALPDVGRPNGIRCDADSQCMSGSCGPAPGTLALFEIGVDPEAQRKEVCGDCSSRHPCEDGERCNGSGGEHGPYLSCVTDPPAETGAWCVEDAGCAGSTCTLPLLFGHGTCAACASDAECAGDQLCGMIDAELGVARACVAAGADALGELCAADAECQSGVCCNSVCSECCTIGAACSNGSACGPLHPSPVVMQTALCDVGERTRTEGQPCTVDSDCESEDCAQAPPECAMCDSGDCDPGRLRDCVLLRQPVGTCR